MLLHALNEDSDQTGRMRRLIQVFAERTSHFVSFAVLRLNSKEQVLNHCYMNMEINNINREII